MNLLYVRDVPKMERHHFSPGQNTNINVPNYTPMKLSSTVAIIRNYTEKKINK